MLGACASEPAIRPVEEIQPAALVAVRDAGVHDLRGVYRSALCSRLTQDDPACTEVLLRLAGESAATAQPPMAGVEHRYRIAFVPGLFSECFEAFARPFQDVQPELQSQGFSVDYFEVAGRGTAAGNAQRLAEHFRAGSDDPRPIIVFAYSKGLVDLLQFMVDFPEEARQVAAIIAVAGAANGSPLADSMHAIYRSLGAPFPLPSCAPGTGQELTDLRPDVRLAWWQAHGHAVSVPVFALVAAPMPERVSPATRATYRQLAKVDARNDGKLLWQDQIPPRSHLLGYVNADHWSIAVPVAKEMPSVSALFRDETPRTALFQAAIEVAVRTLADLATQ